VFYIKSAWTQAEARKHQRVKTDLNYWLFVPYLFSLSCALFPRTGRRTPRMTCDIVIVIVLSVEQTYSIVTPTNQGLLGLECVLGLLFWTVDDPTATTMSTARLKRKLGDLGIDTSSRKANENFCLVRNPFPIFTAC
jgi:hypothetical protein